MEQLQNLDPRINPTADHHHLNVDASRPFRSVQEAVAILSERLSAKRAHSPKPTSLPKEEAPVFSPSPKLQYPSSSPRSSGHSHHATLENTIKKLEAELEQTKAELKLLKERGSKTEIALASSSAELHKSMFELARAGVAASSSSSSSPFSRLVPKEDKIKRDLVAGRMKNSGPLPSLAQVLSVGEKESLNFERTKEGKWMMKKKPIIPLVGDSLFSRKKKKESVNAVDSPLYASSPLRWN